MKYGVLIGRHSALSVCQQNGPAVMSKSSTMEAVSAALKAKRAPLFFLLLVFLTDFTRSDLSETYVPRFVTAAHQSEQPLSEAGTYRNIISHITDTTNLPSASALSVYIYTLHLESKWHVSDMHRDDLPGCFHSDPPWLTTSGKKFILT